MKQLDPFYSTNEWRVLRAHRLALDNYTCVVAGCGEAASVVDHIKRRRDGGSDAIANLRSLCGLHDRQVKELSSGKRRNGGKFKLIGCGVSGWPIGNANEH